MNNLLAQDFSQIQNNAGLGNVNFDLGTIVSRFLPYVFGGAAIALLIYLIMGGFGLMTSQGDPKAIQSAQGKITNALLGFVIIVIAYALVALIGQILGISSFSQIFSGSGSPGVIHSQ